MRHIARFKRLQRFVDSLDGDEDDLGDFDSLVLALESYADRQAEIFHKVVEFAPSNARSALLAAQDRAELGKKTAGEVIGRARGKFNRGRGVDQDRQP